MTCYHYYLFLNNQLQFTTYYSLYILKSRSFANTILTYFFFCRIFFNLHEVYKTTFSYVCFPVIFCLISNMCFHYSPLRHYIADILPIRCEHKNQLINIPIKDYINLVLHCNINCIFKLKAGKNLHISNVLKIVNILTYS